jgi:hypothetical protein
LTGILTQFIRYNRGQQNFAYRCCSEQTKPGGFGRQDYSFACGSRYDLLAANTASLYGVREAES